MCVFYSYKSNGSYDIYGWCNICGHYLVPVRRHSEIYHQKCSANGQNSFSVHSQRIPGKWPSVYKVSYKCNISKIILKLCLDGLPSSFKNVIVKINDNIILIRSNLNIFSNVVKWIEKFSVGTHT